MPETAVITAPDTETREDDARWRGEIETVFNKIEAAFVQIRADRLEIDRLAASTRVKLDALQKFVAQCS